MKQGRERSQKASELMLWVTGAQSAWRFFERLNNSPSELSYWRARRLWNLPTWRSVPGCWPPGTSGSPCFIQACAYSQRIHSGREMQKVVCLYWNCLQKPYRVNQGEMWEALTCLLHSVASLREGDVRYLHSKGIFSPS